MNTLSLQKSFNEKVHTHTHAHVINTSVIVKKKKKESENKKLSEPYKVDEFAVLVIRFSVEFNYLE